MRRHASRDFTTVGVIGLGTMGAGIAEVFARNGYQVIGVEQTDEALDRGRQHLEHSTGRAVVPRQAERGPSRPRSSAGSPSPPTSTALAEADFVVEAVVE